MVKPQDFSLRTKLALTIVVIGIIVSGVNYYQAVEVDRAESVTRDLILNEFPRLEVLREARYQNALLQQFDGSAPISNLTPQAETKLKGVITSQASALEKKVQTYNELATNDHDHSETTQLRAQLTDNTSQVVKLAQAASPRNNPASLKALGESADKLDNVIVSLTSIEEAVVAQNDAKILAANEQIRRMLLFMTLFVTTASVIIGIILMTSIARSLTKIRKGALRIANGDFSAPIAVTSHDELGELGQSFNAMSERLRDSYRRLAIEQQRDEAILQSMGEGLVATDEKGNLLMINPIAADFLHVGTDTSAIGRPFHETYKIYNANSKEKVPIPLEERPIQIALTTGEGVSDVYAFYNGDDQKILLNITATPIKLDNKVVGAISALRDVTKEKEVDRMKTEFISLASHQLRTPLSAIKWFTEMLISGDAGKLKPEQLEFAKNIDDSTTRMIALVNALLNISRIESGRIMVDPRPTDLRELVSGIVNDLRAKTEERQQTLIISVHDDLPKINLDPRLIGQVYLNLLTNAVKYTPKGGEISVFISRKDDQIISQVTDNGYGIPKEQHSRIFQKFFRASNAVKVETDGTGLGLYLIKAVVESSGGKIWFQSEEGKGTTFWFSIPLSGMKPKEGEVTLDA